MSKRVRTLLAFSAVLLLPARDAFAQSVRATVSADVAVVNHYLVGNPLYGASVRVDKPLTESLALRFGAERVSGNASRTGVACGGWVLRPELCPTENLVDDATLTTAGAGLAFWTETRGGLVLNLTGDLRAGAVQSTTRGWTTGNAIGVDAALVGIDLGAEVHWLPLARVPVALDLAATIGALKPLVEQATDSYIPFDEAFRVSRLRLGLSWRPK
jgi:hypothetical protein